MERLTWAHTTQDLGGAPLPFKVLKYSRVEVVLRIVKGKFAGRHIVSPGEKRVRPTAEKVRDGVMALLAPDLPKARVLDLFAGTGALGLEALSRGALYVDFVEFRPSSLHALKANVALLRVLDKTRIFKKDAVPFAEALEEDRYDICFADPPFESKVLDRIIATWRVKPFARILVCEHAPTHAMMAGGKKTVFPGCVVTIYRDRRTESGERKVGG